MRPTFSFCYLFLLTFFSSYSQTQSNCGLISIQQQSTRLTDTGFVFTPIWALGYDLEPLKISKSTFELRFHATTDYAIGPIFIIKCSDGKMKAFKNSYILSNNPNTSLIKVGWYKGDSSTAVFLNKTEYTLPSEKKWEEVVNQLIALHLLQLPSEKQLEELSKAAKLDLVGSGGVTGILELKLGDRYRIIQYKSDYAAKSEGFIGRRNIPEAYWFGEIIKFLSVEIFNQRK